MASNPFQDGAGIQESIQRGADLMETDELKLLYERPLWHGPSLAVNHGTQHRGEAAALLTDYGQSPGDLDFTLFLNEYFNLPD
jgi:uncharacterized damage-inducible protein DinB